MIEKDGFDFVFDESKCIECGGKCCIGDGYVFLEIDEAKKIADYLNISLDEFGMQYLRMVGNRYALKENGDNPDCIFLDSKRQCRIYECRPKNCASFPFWDIFKKNPQGAFRECIGVLKK